VKNQSASTHGIHLHANFRYFPGFHHEESLRRKHNHIIARVVPTGEEISLSRERIQNLDEVDYAVPQKVERVPQGPTARERQVLAYHKKYKTTSPLYESIRAKYPDW